MGEYQTGAGPMDALRAHLKAIRTESARMDPKERGVGVLAARERLAHRLKPLPERLAALDSRVTAKLAELGGNLKPPLKLQSDSNLPESDPCDVMLDIASAAYQISDDTITAFERSQDPHDLVDAVFWDGFGSQMVLGYFDCIHSPFPPTR